MNKKCGKVLKKADLYAMPVQLTYNKLDNYPTKTGGVFSIISFLLICLWLGYAVYGILHWDYNILSSLSLINIAGQERPVYDVTNQQILMAYYMESVNKTAFQGDLSQYVSAVYNQESYNEQGFTDFTYYNSTLCQNVIPKDDPRYSGLVDAYCPDMPANSTF